MKTQQELYTAWVNSYKKDPTHALRDAAKNLKGFKVNMQDALQRFSVDYAFPVAIRHTLKALCAERDRQIKSRFASIERQVGK